MNYDAKCGISIYFRGYYKRRIPMLNLREYTVNAFVKREKTSISIYVD